MLNLCRVKLRDQQRLAHGPLKEYPQYPNGTFGDAVPRAGNASGGGHPGWIVKCKGWETDPDAYIYVIAQAQAFPDAWPRSSATPIGSRIRTSTRLTHAFPAWLTSSPKSRSGR